MARYSREDGPLGSCRHLQRSPLNLLALLWLDGGTYVHAPRVPRHPRSMPGQLLPELLFSPC